MRTARLRWSSALTLNGVLAGALVLLGAAAGCTSVSDDPLTMGGGPGAVDGGNNNNNNNNNNNCGVGTDLIYVVDQDSHLLSFDPSKLGTGEPFTLIGTLTCPAGTAYPEHGGGAATPFSMSVDRQGTAWVLYSSGEIFNVSITDASCHATTFATGQNGYELFGMGFVSDSAGSSTETLYIAGGDASPDNVGDLGTLSIATLTPSAIASLPSAELNPELTGTGEGELYGYFPGTLNTFVARLDKSNSSIQQQWTLDPLGAAVAAWAFAHWGGKFYMFVTTQFASLTSKVLELDPTTGNVTTVVPNSPYVVVGAGVSTCAPVVVE